MNKKILSLFVLLVVVLGATKAFASLTFSSAAITGDTASTIDVGAGNALSLQTTNNGAITTGTGLVTLGGSLNTAGIITLPMTTSSTTGIIFKGANRFLHNFALPGTDGFNTFVGVNAGNFTMTGSTTYQGSYNTAVGDSALSANTVGNSNVAIGPFTLNLNTTGLNNVGIGDSALSVNTTGNFNTGVGTFSLNQITTGNNNTAYGNTSLETTTTGNNNTTIGGESLLYNVTGSGNVALGYSAGRRELGSNAFYVNNIDQVNTAGDKAYSLLYGTFSGVAGSLVGQKLTVNALMNINLAKLTVYANNAAAIAGGLVAGDLYRTGGDPDPIMVVH